MLAENHTKHGIPVHHVPDKSLNLRDSARMDRSNGLREGLLIACVGVADKCEGALNRVSHLGEEPWNRFGVGRSKLEFKTKGARCCSDNAELACCNLREWPRAAELR